MTGAPVGAPRSRLVGRDDELDLLVTALSGTSAAGVAVRISGAAGIGKSALLAATVDEAVARGYSVLRTQGCEAERHLPYACLHQLLRPLLTSLDVLPPGQGAALRQAFGLENSAAAPTPFFVYLAALELVSDTAGRKPLLMVADDTQWMDSASREAIEFVGRRIAHDRIMLVQAMRMLPGDEPISSLGVSLPLGGLDEPHARELALIHAPGMSKILLRHVVAVSDGNPLALLELPGVLMPSQERLAAVSDVTPLTGRLESAFGARLDCLGAGARRLLLVAAPIDTDRIDETLSAAAALSQYEEADELSVLDAAAASGLLGVDARRFRFRHPLVRSAVIQTAGDKECRNAYRAIAEVVRAEPDRRVWALSSAARDPDESLAVALERAADHAAGRGSVAFAQLLMERAARFSETASARAHRFLQAAQLAFELGRHEEFSCLAREAARNDMDAADQASLGRLEGAFDDGSPGDVRTVRRMLVSAAGAREAGAVDSASTLLVMAARNCYWGGAGDSFGQQVMDLMATLPIEATDPMAITVDALLRPFRRGPEIVATLAEWAESEDIDGLPLGLLGQAAFVAGDFDRSLLFARRAAEGLRAQGRLALLAQALVLQAFSSLYLGRWDLVQVFSDEAHRLAVDTHQPIWAACALLGRANISGLRGERGEALLLADEVEATGLTTNNRALLNGVQLSRGFAALGASAPDEASLELTRMTDPADRAYQIPQTSWAVDYLVEAADASGNGPEAAQIVGRLSETTSLTPAGGVRRAAALADLMLVDEHLVEKRFLAATSDRGVTAWHRARAALVFGAWLRRQRRPTDAQPHLQAAKSVFDGLQAPSWSAQAGRELQAGGRRADSSSPGRRRRRPASRGRWSVSALGLGRRRRACRSRRSSGGTASPSHG